MSKLFDLTGKVAIVVGATGGIGRALALGLADHGADVVVASRRLQELEKVADEVRALGRRSLSISVDVTQEPSVTAMVARSLEAFPRIDILVNASGLAIRRPAGLDSPPCIWTLLNSLT